MHLKCTACIAGEDLVEAHLCVADSCANMTCVLALPAILESKCTGICGGGGGGGGGSSLDEYLTIEESESDREDDDDDDDDDSE